MFRSDQTLLIRLPERTVGGSGEFTGRLLFQRDTEIAIRIETGPDLAGLVSRAPLPGLGAQVEYRQGNYLCSFQGKFELVADRSIPVSLLLVMPLPGTVRRVLDPGSGAA